MKRTHALAVRGILASVLLGQFLLWECGCGPKMGPTVQVRGKVTLDGKPFSEGSIWFSLARSGAGFHANLGPGGEYSVSILDARPGDQYGVFIGGIQPKDPNEVDKSGNPRGIPAPPVPTRYWESKTSGLTAAIDKAGPVTCDFELKSK